MAAEHPREDGGEGQGTFFRANRHDHDLQMYEGLGLYRCMGCKEMGVNFGYECSDPFSHSREKIIFHVYCATLEDGKQHPILEENNTLFRFRPKTKLQHRCTACDHELKGFVYENSGMRLHPLCLMLPPEFVYEGQRRFTLVTWKGNPYKCYCCGEEIKHGWKYICGDVCMDVGCAKYYLQGLSAQGIQSRPVRRRRDHLKDVAKRVARYVVPAAGVAGGVAGVVNCFLG